MIRSEGGGGVFPVFGVAFTDRVAARVGFLRRLVRSVSLAEVASALFPFASTLLIAPLNLPRTIVPE